MGNIQIKGVLLRRVLHVPGVKTNLLSLQRLIDDTGWRFLLDSSQCVLCVKETGERILFAWRKGGLLLLDGGVEKEIQGRVLHTQSKESVVLLHRRLGHPSFHLLKQVYPNLFKHLDIQNLICESCQFAKHKRTHFSKSDHRKKSPFDMIQSDVWGPCSILGKSNQKWFLLFIDDFSRYTWIYMLRAKSEVPTIIIQFIDLIFNQFDKRVRIFRSDNAKEYFSSEVNSYMENHGIIHESSCVNTPQQNGLAELKIGHIMASVRSLLFQGNCPKSYWGEAVATSVHLINRIRSRTLSLQSPIDLLSSSYPYLSLITNLVAKVFGCIAYIHAHHAGKLDPRVVKCIFVGYSSTQKGYICYHPSTKKRFITADANFDEYYMFYDEVHRSEEYLVTDEETTGTPNLNDGSLEEFPMTTDQENEENQELEKEPIRIQESEDNQIATNEGWSIAVSKGIRECRKRLISCMQLCVLY